ncbi:MAG: hypothetical protein HZA94_01835, partial [Candidatus Vogelbacteria bacterium]|nr:hypothetical protein [Candidatus Vogelbacteria bacterium]
MNDALKINNVHYAAECIICGNPRLVTFNKKRFHIKQPSSWENESTMEVLGLAECIASFKYCKKCHHIFRDPLYD